MTLFLENTKPPAPRSARFIAHVPRMLCLLVIAGGCSTFSTVRSASVRPGVRYAGQVSTTGRPGPAAASFFQIFECYNCDNRLFGAEAAVSYGWNRSRYTPPLAVAVGTNGFFPYVDAYLQLGSAGSARNAFGVGGRLGRAFAGWRQHQLYGRFDLALGPNRTLLLNPGFFAHRGRTGIHSGSLTAFVQGAGVEFEMGNVSVTPSLSAVFSSARQQIENTRKGPTRKLFPTASIGVSVYPD